MISCIYFKSQYCLKTYSAENLSMDHVIPKAQGGKLTWTNTVCACKTCNAKKSHLTLPELSKIGMKLRKLPHLPTNSEIQMKGRLYHNTGYLHPHWRDFI